MCSRGLVVGMLLGAGAMGLVLLVQNGVARQANTSHTVMVSQVSSSAIGGIRQSGMALAGVSSQSPATADTLVTVVYYLQLADDSLMVLQFDPSFPRGKIQDLSEQLTTARVQLQSMILQQQTGSLGAVKDRIVAISEQFPKDIGTHPEVTLIAVLKDLRLP